MDCETGSECVATLAKDAVSVGHELGLNSIASSQVPKLNGPDKSNPNP